MASSMTLPTTKRGGNLSMDRAAFLLIRIKRIFHKKRAKDHVTDKPIAKKKPPLLRAKTLPAIITPSLNIIQAQLEANNVVTNIPDVGQEGKESPSHTRTRRSPSAGSEGQKFPGSHKWQLLVGDNGVKTSCKSPTVSPRHSVSSMSSTSSYQSTGKDSSKQKYDQSSSASSRAGFAKLARLLTPKEKTSDKNVQSATTPVTEQKLRKANSIDSLLDVASPGYTVQICDVSDNSLDVASTSQNDKSTINSGGLTVPNKTIPNSPSIPAKLETHKRGIPTSPSMPSKLAKDISAGLRQSSMELLLEGVPLTKAERKRLEKVNKFNIDLQALFAAVEHQHIERARSILETTGVDVNSVNGDGFSPLDIAVMTNNVPMIKLLQWYGGRESLQYATKDSRSHQLNGLVKEAGRCVEDLTTCVLSAATNGSLSNALLKEKERQLSLWQRRLQLLRRMKTGFERLRPPDPPTFVVLEVVGTNSLRVRFVEPDTAHNAECIVTKYKVEWSSQDDFKSLAGYREVNDVHRLEVIITDLIRGTPYFVRVAAGNSKGYSNHRNSSPLSATPSCWRDVEGESPRVEGKMGKLDDLFNQIVDSGPTYSPEVKALADLADTPQQQRRQVRKSIKNLFTPAPKFQKSMKRGVFLASLLYNEDKILVTPEETLPILEVDETYPSSLHTDFHWLMKVACTWEDVKALRQDMEKSPSSSNVHLRSRLLQAVEQMQAALGIQDLGQLFYKPVKDTEGTIVICTVKHIADIKSMVPLSVRWLPLSKIQRKLSSGGNEANEPPNASEILLSSLQEMINYNQASGTCLTRGLYFGYIKLKSSVDLIRVLVPQKAPNVLPHCRIRENPHVSLEEWKWLSVLKCGDKSATPSEVQLKFQRSLSSAARSLFQQLDIPPWQMDTHRIYDMEVIELSPDVSFILILPPVESVCSVAGQTDELTSRTDCIPLPVQIFEMIHMTTYQKNFISRYSRLSSILEMANMVAQQAHREAFSSAEVASAKCRLNQLQEFQGQVDNIWRGMRWIMDVLAFARDKQVNGGIPLSGVLVSKTGSPSPAPSPHQSPVQMCYQQREDCRNGSDKNYLRITTSSSYTLLDSNRGDNHLEIRRCASTSKLQVSVHREEEEDVSESTVSVNEKGLGVKEPSDCFDAEENGIKIPCPQLNECAKDRDQTEMGMSSNSVHSSLTGSNKSLLSDLPIEDDTSENGSVYSKDSACSVGDIGKSPDDCEVSEMVKRPSSSNSSGSNPGDASSGILRVYAAYETGLPSGTSVKLHVTPQTTAREVVDLVVKQLNMAVILKGRGGPIYGSNQIQNFCLVAVVGSREKCLGDDFQPLKLSNPWTKGKLFVRMNNVLEESSK
ncbi:ankyrin repeat and fibronectin type-III domain-containing protein 1 isoform X2 [Centruroides vittatus]|uniref:ankyrin repeat and fibronectin type-III domain-containing protein 1 isoform X2 n=1 Tax=Centruroides vittatus TaxID=120091 RepID=UPI00350EBD44